MIGPRTTPDAILAILEQHPGPRSSYEIADLLAAGGVSPRIGVSKMVSAMFDSGLLRYDGGRWRLSAVWRRGSDGQWVAIGSARECVGELHAGACI